jgi:cystathionine beta-lyase
MPRSWATKLIHTDATVPEGFRSLATATYRGSTTLFPDTDRISDTWNHEESPYTYGLYGTPTTLELAARLSELEGGRHTFIVPGGQAALALIYLSFAKAGERVLIPHSIYGPSRELAHDLLRGLGVEVAFYPPLAGAAIADHLTPNTTLVWCESPGSVTMEVQDVPAIAAAAHRQGAVVACDNTWAAGVYFDALAHGADVTTQALTKYVGGHSDLLLGSVTVNDQALYERLGAVHKMLGLNASPDDCTLALRGMKSMAARLRAIEQSALRVARWMAERPEVERVLHPALPSCPGHDAWARDFTGSSGLFSIVFASHVSGGAARAFVDGLELFEIGYSWGGVTSLAVPWRFGRSRPDVSYGERLVRLHIGLEETDDLIADLEQSLARTIGGTH